MRKLTIVLFALIISSLFLVNVSVSDFPPDPEGEYSPWGDLNNDGIINIFDIVWLANRYGTTGTPLNVTELLLELDTRMDVLNATVIDFMNQLSGYSGGVVNIKDYSQVYGLTTSPVFGTVTLTFDNPFNSANYYLFTKLSLDQDFDPGSGNIPAGTIVFAQNITKTVANFTAEVLYGEDLLKGAEVDLFYIAIEMGTIMRMQAVEGGKFDGEVQLGKVQTDPEAEFIIEFEQPFATIDPPKLLALVVMKGAGDGLLEGAVVRAVEDLKGSAGNWTGFDLEVSKYGGGSLSNGAKVFVTWIAIGTREVGGSQPKHCAGIEMLACGYYLPPPTPVSYYVKIDFPITFTNASNVNLSASGIVISSAVSEGSPLKITIVNITTTYAILALEGWNGAMWEQLALDDEVQISYTAVEN